VSTFTYQIDENLIDAENPDVFILEIVERSLIVITGLPD
jgi:hypothetical protein